MATERKDPMGNRKPTVICVCTANICRSPMAEKLLDHALRAERHLLRSIEVTSAGISAWAGEAATGHSIQALQKVGLDLSGHRSRPLSAEMVSRAALILVMTESHRNAIRSIYPESDVPVLLLRELIPDVSEREIPDPFGSEYLTYENCRDSIVEAVPAVIDYLKANLGKHVE